MSDKIIGIDLGTTNSCVAILEGDEAVVIHNREGGRTTPSMVSWTKDGDIVVGTPAKRQMVTNPDRTVFGVKRLIGRRADSKRMEELAKSLPYVIVASSNGDAWVEIDGKQHPPQEIAAHILRTMREIAEDYLGESIREAVVTVPAYFDDVQRQATKDAGAIAGLEVRAILNEPTAAALAYGAHKDKDKDQRLAVFDLGGGTFDVSILTMEGGVFEVLATSGDVDLGGDDFDHQMIEMLALEFQLENDIDLRDDTVALQRLKEASERAKIELSTTTSTDINLPFVAAGPSGPMHLQREINRVEFEELVGPLLKRLNGPCETALKEAHCKAEDIDQVLLVGGMTRMPAVQKRVVEIFGKEPSKNVNPDEIVAIGAATQSAIIGGELEEVILLDVTPHDMGIRAKGDRMSVLIPANTTIPTRARKVFATTEDSQSFVSIDVYQGPSDKASDNRFLGRFLLGDLHAKKAGEVHVEVSLSLDANGILSVNATELPERSATSITIEANSGLTSSQLEDLIRVCAEGEA